MFVMSYQFVREPLNAEETDRLETTEIYLNICPEDALREFFQKVDGARRQRWEWPSIPL